jgi:hypothetical protein
MVMMIQCIMSLIYIFIYIMRIAEEFSARKKYRIYILQFPEKKYRWDKFLKR